MVIPTHYVIKLDSKNYFPFFFEDFQATKRVLKEVFKLSALKDIWYHATPLDGGYMFAFKSKIPYSQVDDLKESLALKLGLAEDAIEIRINTNNK